MGDEKKLFKTEEQKTRAEVATRIRSLADEIEQGTVSLQNEGNQVSFHLPENLTLELEAEEEIEEGKTKRSLEIELEWTEEQTEKQE